MVRHKTYAFMFAAGLSFLLAFATTGLSKDVSWAEKTSALTPSASAPTGTLTANELKELTARGEALFKATFTDLDGVGRPGATQAILPTKARSKALNKFARTSGLDAGSCAACHNQPFIGGAGDFVTNVFVSEGFTNADFDSTDPQFSNERGTNHLFGAGLIELLAREMSTDLASHRKQVLADARKVGKSASITLITKGVNFGILSADPDGLLDLSNITGVDDDLIVRPFSQKGVMTSLRQFSVNAMNHHHGMQADERFGDRWTGEADFDEDGHNDEVGAADISALVAWQATLPSPQQTFPKDEDWQQAAIEGEKAFGEFGCDTCHIKALPLKVLSFSDPGPFDVSGTLNSTSVKDSAIYDLSLLAWTGSLERNEKGEILVPLFGDLKRHTMTDQSNEQLGNEMLSQRFVDRTIFLTSELWGVGSTSPYGHRNDFTTLDSIIRAHGGDAAFSKKLYSDASEDSRLALIAFLKTLVIQP